MWGQNRPRDPRDTCWHCPDDTCNDDGWNSRPWRDERTSRRDGPSCKRGPPSWDNFHDRSNRNRDCPCHNGPENRRRPFGPPCSCGSCDKNCGPRRCHNEERKSHDFPPWQSRPSCPQDNCCHCEQESYAEEELDNGAMNKVKHLAPAILFGLVWAFIRSKSKGPWDNNNRHDKSEESFRRGRRQNN